MPRAQDITVCLAGFEQHRARPDLSDDSGFWLRIASEHASPFLDAYKASPTGFHGFVIEQRTVKQARSSTLMAQILKIEEGPTETRVLIRPDPKVEAALKGLGY